MELRLLANAFFAIVAVAAGAHQSSAPAAAAGMTLDDYKMQKDIKSAEAEAAEAKEAKMAAVNKVISMLEDLRNQVLADGEEEAHTYNEFSCFCKDTTAAKSKAIEEGEDEKTALTATINELVEERESLDTEIAGFEAAIQEAEKKMAELKATREETQTTYEKNEADLSGAITALEQAIGVIKSSKSPSLLQLQGVANTVRTATLLAEALGIDNTETQKIATFFLQQAPEVPMEDYKFHSDSIIETLEKLLADFKAEKNTVDSDEVASIHTYESEMQSQTNIVQAKTKSLNTAREDKAVKMEEIASDNQQLSVVAATLLDDQQYAAELATICQDKALTWDQRSKVRQDELSALTSAIAIIQDTVAEKTGAATMRLAQQGTSIRIVEAVARDDNAMEALEADAESAEDAPGFFQRSIHRHLLRGKPASSPTNNDSRHLVIDLLRLEGKKLKSKTLSALANEIAADPLAKVKVLIQDLIERLLQEQANEANQKGWCDKSISDAEQKRGRAAEEIEELNGNMEALEARIDTLKEEMEHVSLEYYALKAARTQQTMMRNHEKNENAQTVLEAQAGLEAVSQAIDILTKFYATAAKSEVAPAVQAPAAPAAPAAAALVQLQTKKGPADDAPDAGFENFEAYTGMGSTSGGIVGMLEVIQGDFQRTITETEKAEAQSQKDYVEWMTESGMSLAEKEQAMVEQTTQKNDAEEKLASDQEALDSQTALLQGAISELLELQPACVDTGMSYEERVANREEEISALHKAMCILENYQQYGPSGAAGDC